MARGAVAGHSITSYAILSIELRPTWLLSDLDLLCPGLTSREQDCMRASSSSTVCWTRHFVKHGGEKRTRQPESASPFVHTSLRIAFWCMSTLVSVYEWL
eukprot:2158071-Pleurochrysis_carterae.AAC.1